MSTPAAPTNDEVNAWLTRVDDLSAAVREILSEDPLQAATRRAAREQRRAAAAAAAAAARAARVKLRYETSNYCRYARDDVIDAMLRAVDEADDTTATAKAQTTTTTTRHAQAAAAGKRPMDNDDDDDEAALYSTAERVALEEAQRMKREAAAAVAAAAWQRAYDLYTHALQLQVVDEALDTTLHNNRALVLLKLRRYVEAASDATCVLRREPDNVKALLRRAAALRGVHRPLDALVDVAAALRLQPRNVEAQQAHAALRRAEAELRLRDAFVASAATSRDDEGDTTSAPAESTTAATAEKRSCGCAVDDAQLLRDALARVSASTSGTAACAAALHTCTQCLLTTAATHGDGAAVFVATHTDEHGNGAVARILAVTRDAAAAAVAAAAAATAAAAAGGATAARKTSQCHAHDEPHADSSNEGDEASTSRVWTAQLMAGLRLLSLLLDACETTTQVVSEEVLRPLLTDVVALLRIDARDGRQHATRQDSSSTNDKHDNMTESLQCAALDVLRSCTRYYADVVRRVVEEHNEGDEPLLWCVYAQTTAAAAASASLSSPSLRSTRHVVPLYHLARLLEALLRCGGCNSNNSDNGNDNNKGDKDVHQLTQQLFAALPSHMSVAEDGNNDSAVTSPWPLVLRVVYATLQPRMPPLLSYAGAALALYTTSLTPQGSDGTAAVAVVTQALLTSRVLTDALYDTCVAALARCNTHDNISSSSGSAPDSEVALYASDVRLLEALYALLYNLVLHAPQRDAFVAQWSSRRVHVPLRGWQWLIAHDNNKRKHKSSSNNSNKKDDDDGLRDDAVVRSVLALVSKCASAGDAALCRALMADEAWLWRRGATMLQRLTHDGDADHATTTATTMTRATAATTDDVHASECLEHVTTLLAILHCGANDTKTTATTATIAAQERVCMLLRVLRVCQPPSERVVEAVTSSLPECSSNSSVVTTTSAQSAMLVCLGNAALLLATLLTQATTTAANKKKSSSSSSSPLRDVDDDDDKTHSALSRALVEGAAVDVLLQSLRDTRTALQQLRHALGSSACATWPTATRLQLQRWQAHCVSSQNNIAMTIARVCAVAPVLRERLRSLDGFETLAALQREQQRP